MADTDLYLEGMLAMLSFNDNGKQMGVPSSLMMNNHCPEPSTAVARALSSLQGDRFERIRAKMEHNSILYRDLNGDWYYMASFRVIREMINDRTALEVFSEALDRLNKLISSDATPDVSDQVYYCLLQLYKVYGQIFENGEARHSSVQTKTERGIKNDFTKLLRNAAGRFEKDSPFEATLISKAGNI